MKVVFNKKGFKYICEVCRNPFNWNSDCWSYGKFENNPKDTIVVCSSDCKNQLSKSIKRK